MPEREGYVPQRVSDVTAGLRRLGWVDGGDGRRFDTLCRLLSAWFHHRFRERELAIVES